MSDSRRYLFSPCPKCGESVELVWVECPNCGHRLKRKSALSTQTMIAIAAAWLVVSVLIALGTRLLGVPMAATTIVFCILVGMPALYIAGKALLFRMMGKPLTQDQLVRTSFRVSVVAFVLFIVTPVVTAVSVLIFALVVCSSQGIGHMP